MKKLITTTALVLASLIGGTPVFADAWTQLSFSCNWFYKRYKVHVGIKRQGQWGSYCADTDSNCSGTERECRYPPEPSPSNPFQVVWARAWAVCSPTQIDAYEFGGYDGQDQWLAGSDVVDQIPHYSTDPMVEKLLFGTKERYGKSRLTIGSASVDEANHTVRISDLQGSMAVKTFDKANDFSTFTISVTQIDSLNADDFSDAAYKKQLVWSSKAMIRNGKLLLEGQFDVSNFALVDQSEESSVGFTMKEMVIQLPRHVDMSRISLNVGVDNGNFGMGISEKFRMNDNVRAHQISESHPAEEEFTFSNYPNPVSGKFTVSVKLPQTQNIEVGLYDMNGNLLKSLYRGKAAAKELLQFQTDVSDFKRNVYYLKLITADKVLARKLILR